MKNLEKHEKSEKKWKCPRAAVEALVEHQPFRKGHHPNNSPHITALSSVIVNEDVQGFIISEEISAYEKNLVAVALFGA